MRHMALLLVEDNAADAALTSELLMDSGSVASIDVAQDGDLAMAHLQQGLAGDSLPDLILLDLNLPKRDGREFLEALKADPDLRYIPVIVMTTSRSEFDVSKVYDLHCNAYVTKPVDLTSYMEVIGASMELWAGFAVPAREHTEVA